MGNSLQGDKEKWRSFWESFGKNIKMGIVEDSKNRKKLATLCQFHTSYRPTFLSSKKKDVNNMTRLNAYVSRLKDRQKIIYYFATNNTKTAPKAPFVETLIKKDYEILFITDPLDEYVVMNLAKYKNVDGSKKIELLDVTRENVEEGDRKETIKVSKDEDEICLMFKEVLGEKIEKVVVSSRLDSFPCVLTTSKFGVQIWKEL